MIGDEILIEIDTTLDQLIRNAEVIQKIDIKELSETEIEAFQKTQESLLHHFIHLDHHLETKRKNLRIPDKRSASFKIQEKLVKFEKLKSAYHKNIAETANIRKMPILSKRRSKRFLEEIRMR